MPRWLVASLLALLLSCLGFAAVAHDLAGAERQGCSHQLQASNPAAADEADNLADAFPASDELVPDHGFEAIGATHIAFVPVHFSEPAPRPAVTATPSPSRKRPQRPPRSEAFSAQA